MKTPVQNPLLNASNLPHQAIPFQEIKPEHFLPALEEAVKIAKANIARIKSNTEQPNFINTIERLETAGEKVDTISHVFYNLLSAASNDELEKLAQEIGPILSEYSNDILLDSQLFEKVKVVYENQSKENLTQEQKQVLENTYKDFTRNGALLSEDKKEQLRKLDQEASKLGPQFSQNVVKATYDFKFFISDEKLLAGLPESAIEAAKAAAKEAGNEGQWLITLEAPSLIPFLTFADHRESREKLWKAYNSRCFGGEFDNQSIILKTINLRHQRAQLLGYKTHADFTLEKRMAETPERVESFLNTLLEASLPAAQKELEELAEYAKSKGGPSDLKPWDISYYSEKLKEEKFKFNEEELRPYFPLDSVVRGAFEHARLLFGIRFEKSTGYPVYHPDVSVYEVFEENTQKFMGLFYTDFYPRPSKKGGAWMTDYYQQGLYAGEVKRPHVSIVCNFTKPVGDKPALLNFSEAQTLFHEFGHSLHSLLSQCHYRSVSGTSTYWDFVELPSQLMENWISEKEGLDLFAKHYKTGEVIPSDLAKKLKDSQKFMAGWMSLRQLNFSILDLAWHSHKNPETIKDVSDFEIMVTQKTSLLPPVEGTRSSTAFSHIFAGGYSAGYYSYKWAEALDADAFELFLEKGLFDKKTATDLKENVLSKGGSDHPMKLYKKFRGREPDPKALLRRDGLIEAR